LILNRTHPYWDDAVQLNQTYNLDAASLVALSNDLLSVFQYRGFKLITHDLK